MRADLLKFNRQFFTVNKIITKLTIIMPAGTASGIIMYHMLPYAPNYLLLLIATIVNISVLLFLRNLLLSYSFFSNILLLCIALQIGMSASALQIHNVNVRALKHKYIINGRAHVKSITLYGNRQQIILTDIKTKYNRNIKGNIRLTETQKYTQSIKAGHNVIFSAYLYPLTYGYYYDPPNNPLRDGYIKNIIATGRLIRPVQIITANTKITDKINNLRAYIIKEINKHTNNRNGGIIAALLVGRKDVIDYDTIDLMNKSGLAHLIAISGLHMCIAAALAFKTVNALLILTMPNFALNRDVRALSAIIAPFICAAYLILTGHPISAQRAFIMTCTAYTAIIFNKKYDSSRALAAAFTLLVIINPISLFNPGLQLSFTAVATIILLSNLNIITGYNIKHKIISSLLYSACITLTTAPYLIHHFNSLSIGGIISNVIAIPLTSLIIMPTCMASLPLMLIGAEKITLMIANYAVSALLSIARYTLNIPYNYVRVPHLPSLSAISLSIGLLILIGMRKRQKLNALPFVLFSIIFCISTKLPTVILYNKTAAVRTDDNQVYCLTSHCGNRVLRDFLSKTNTTSVITKNNQINNTHIRCDKHLCTYHLSNRKIYFIKRKKGIINCRNISVQDIVVNLTDHKMQCSDNIYIKHQDIRNNATYIYFNKDKVKVINLRSQNIMKYSFLS